MRPRFNSNIFSKTRKDGDTSLIIVNTSFSDYSSSTSLTHHQRQDINHNHNTTTQVDMLTENENLICLFQSLSFELDLHLLELDFHQISEYITNLRKNVSLT